MTGVQTCAFRSRTRVFAHPRPRRGRVLAALILAAAIAVVATVVVLATQSSGKSPTTTPPQSAAMRTFVDRIENVLAQSRAGRRDIAAALTNGFNCSISRAEAAARVNSVADNRQSVLSQLSGVQGPTTQADDVVTRLLAALQKSIEADRHYHDGFVADAKAGCPLPTNASFRSAAQFDAEATTAKERFVAAFNPIADRFERRTWSATEF